MMYPETFKTFLKFLISKWVNMVKSLEILPENLGFPMFLNICSQVFHFFREKSSGNSNQKSKLFQKMGEVPKLFPDDYLVRNGNIHPWPKHKHVFK